MLKLNARTADADACTELVELVAVAVVAGFAGAGLVDAVARFGFEAVYHMEAVQPATFGGVADGEEGRNQHVE